MCLKGRWVLFWGPWRAWMSENASRGALTLCLSLCTPRMDFLVLFSLYLAVLLIGGAVLCTCLKTRYRKGLVRGGGKVTVRLLGCECHQSEQLTNFLAK